MSQGFRRWLRVGVFALLGLLLLAFILAYALIDKRKVLALASASIEHATGRTLALNGPVSLRLLPNLSVIAEDVVLGNAAWATDPVMVKADRVAFSIAWKPLLQQKIVIDEVAISGVVVNLQAAPDGLVGNGQGRGQTVAGNWQLDGIADTFGSGGFSVGDFDLKSINMADVSLRYRDAAGNVAQGLVLDRLSGRMANNALNFSGDVRWQQQPIDVSGSVSYLTNQPLQVDLKVKSARIDLRILHAASVAASPATAVSSRLFDAQPLGFALIPLINGAFDVSITSLVLPSGIELPGFSTRITLDAGAGGVLNLQQLTAGFGQGVIKARGQLRGYTLLSPQLTVRGHAQGFTIDKLIAQANPQNKSSLVQGGPGVLAVNLSANGHDISTLASSLNGQIQLSVGAARLSQAFVNSGGDFALSLINAINPLHKNTAYTQLDCAVGYLPISNGMVTINRSVGLETDRLNVVLDGQVNLKNETLNIKLHPKEKSGLTTGVNMAGMVMINGTLRNPKIGVNKTGVASQAANVGLAVVTGGISLAAQNVVAVSSRSSACQNVLRPWSGIDDQMAKQN